MILVGLSVGAPVGHGGGFDVRGKERTPVGLGVGFLLGLTVGLCGGGAVGRGGG